MNEQQGTPFFIKKMTQKALDIISQEVGTTESQLLIKRKIITPVINMIYTELYPYIIAMIVSILTILILSMMTCIAFFIFFLQSRK